MIVQKVRVATLIVIAIASLLLATIGCGEQGHFSNSMNGGGIPGGPSSGTSIAGGNWSIVGTSASSNNVYAVGGAITQDGTTLTGKVHLLGPCEDSQAEIPSASISLTGSIKGDQFTLTSTPTIAGSVINILLTGSGTSLKNLTGTFTINGSCGASDEGTAIATLVPPIYGPWLGKGVATSGDANVTVGLSLTQKNTPDEFGTFYVSGTLTYGNSACAVSAVPVFGYIAGSRVLLTVDEVDSNPVVFVLSGTLVPPFNSVLSGSYQTFAGGTVPGCTGDQGTISLDFNF
jgi:hypothetical protein